MCLYNYLASATYSRPLKITSLQDELATMKLSVKLQVYQSSLSSTLGVSILAQFYTIGHF